MSVVARNNAVDLLKVFLAILVVALHTRCFEDVSSTLGQLTVDGICRIAVPTFLVINGYFFSRNVDGPDERLRWIFRILGLYALWMVIYAPFWLQNLSVFGSLRIAIFGYYHLWYLLGLAGAGILFSFIHHWSTKRLVVIALSLFLIGVFIQYAKIFELLPADWSKVYRPVEVQRNFLFISFPFFTAGVLIHRLKLDSRISSKFASALTAAGVFGLLFESHLIKELTAYGEGLDNLLFSGLAAPAVFILAKSSRLQVPGGKSLSLYANGIFFVHLAFVKLIWIYAPTMPETLATAVVIASSTILVWAILRFNTLAKYLF